MPARSKRRWYLVLLASASAGAMLLSPATASASVPDCFEVDFAEACAFSADADFTDAGLCAFPVEVHVTGAIRYRPFFSGDSTGEPLRERFHYRTRAKVTNLATGRFFTDGDDYSRSRIRLSDDSVIQRDIGLFHDARMDDGRRLFHQSGEHLALLDANDEAISEVFHGRFDSEAAFPGKVCPLLARAA
jgi:hypothetical protein